MVALRSFMLPALIACFAATLFLMNRRIERLENSAELLFHPPSDAHPISKEYAAHEFERLTSVNGYTSTVNSISWSDDRSEMKVNFTWIPASGEKSYRFDSKLTLDRDGAYICKLQWPSGEQPPLFLNVAPKRTAENKSVNRSRWHPLSS